jgi:hypothetical protein
MIRKYKSARDKIIDFLEKNKERAYTANEVSKAVGVSRILANTILRRMKEGGTVRAKLLKTNRTRGRNLIIYYAFYSYRQRNHDKLKGKCFMVREVLRELAKEPKYLMKVLRDMEKRRKKKDKLLMKEMIKESNPRRRRR